MNPPQPTPPPIEDILPLLVDPVPAWVVGLWVAGSLLLLGAIWVLVRHLLRRRPSPPPLPGDVFASDLDAITARSAAMNPYELAVATCDALRTYLAAIEPGLPRSRTSEEFLRAAAETPRFGARERELLSAFLTTADRIKFAHAAVPAEDAAGLVTQARALLRPVSVA
jgi:hypothetical protein